MIGCSVGDCSGEVVSGGLCDKHRKRLARHGSVDAARPSDWGLRSKHPLYHSWKWLRRHQTQQSIAPEWSDFWRFVADVGERPTEKHKLFSADDSKPLGPGNFVWKEAVSQRVPGEDERTYQIRRQKVYRALRTEAFQGYELKRNYGLARQDVIDMLGAQGHVCAICLRRERAVIRGKTITLAVDHCHTSGAIRGLLCSDCNRGLGLFRDDPKALARAIEYLKPTTT